MFEIGLVPRHGRHAFGDLGREMPLGPGGGEGIDHGSEAVLHESRAVSGEVHAPLRAREDEQVIHHPIEALGFGDDVLRKLLPNVGFKPLAASDEVLGGAVDSRHGRPKLVR